MEQINNRRIGSGMTKARSVLQIDGRGEMPFDSSAELARALGVKPGTAYRWIGDGKQHDGFWYEWERDNEQKNP